MELARSGGVAEFNHSPTFSHSHSHFSLSRSCAISLPAPSLYRYRFLALLPGKRVFLSARLHSASGAFALCSIAYCLIFHTLHASSASPISLFHVSTSLSRIQASSLLGSCLAANCRQALQIIRPLCQCACVSALPCQFVFPLCSTCHAKP